MYLQKLVLVFLFIFVVDIANAEVDFIAGMGLHSGGDTLATVIFTDGSNEKIKAGELVSIDLGMVWDMESMEGRAMIGMKNDQITATNGDLDFTRYTSQIMLFYPLERWYFGGGLTYHFDIELDGSGQASVANAKYRNALGYMAEIDYYFNSWFFIGLQYTDIEYDRSTSYGKSERTFDGSSIGIVFAGRW